MEHITIITADYGDYDTPKLATPQQGVIVDEFAYVTDTQDVRRLQAAQEAGWTVHQHVAPHMHTNVAAKVPKFRPDLIAPNAKYTLWVDAGAAFGPEVGYQAIVSLQGGEMMSLFPHPHRTDLHEEVKASRALPKYSILELEKQVEHYLADGYPNDRLWATGCIARRHNGTFGAWLQRFGSEWLVEVARWGFQDQLSFAYLVWRYRALVAEFGPHLYESPNISFGGHVWSA